MSHHFSMAEKINQVMPKIEEQKSFFETVKDNMTAENAFKLTGAISLGAVAYGLYKISNGALTIADVQNTVGHMFGSGIQGNLLSGLWDGLQTMGLSFSQIVQHMSAILTSPFQSVSVGLDGSGTFSEIRDAITMLNSVKDGTISMNELLMEAADVGNHYNTAARALNLGNGAIEILGASESIKEGLIAAGAGIAGGISSLALGSKFAKPDDVKSKLEQLNTNEDNNKLSSSMKM